MIIKSAAFFALTIGLFGGAIQTFGSAQLQDETKSVRASEYTKNRRPSAAGGGAAATASVPASFSPRMVRVKVRKKSRPAKPGPKPPGRVTLETALIGFTIWREESAKGKDEDPSKGLVEVDANTRRVDSDSPLEVGDKVRIGIESLSHAGYLYVINREKYADGTYGTPSLIFPTQRYRGRNNTVNPGDIVYIPGPGRAFNVSVNTGRRQEAEELIIIISPKPIIDPAMLKMDAIEISANQALQWLKDAATEVTQIDQIDTVSTRITEAEVAAGNDLSKGLKEQPLSQDDLLPQTMLEMRVKRGGPIIGTITVPIAKK